MSAALPEVVDAWRMVTARRRFDGTLPLGSLVRLAGSLADTAGEVRYALEFGRDEFGTARLAMHVETRLPLTCQRTLERFELPVAFDLALGLIAREEDEAALPPGFEPLLVPADGALRLAEAIEDELILALPVVPVKPGSEASEDGVVYRAGPVVEEEERRQPFAALAALRKRQDN